MRRTLITSLATLPTFLLALLHRPHAIRRPYGIQRAPLSASAGDGPKVKLYDADVLHTGILGRPVSLTHAFSDTTTLQLIQDSVFLSVRLTSKSAPSAHRSP